MAKKSAKRSNQLGKFVFPGGRELLGELRLDGRQTFLKFQDDTSIPPLGDVTTLRGELNDATKVTCIECITSSTGTRSVESGAVAHLLDVFPHFVALGNAHLDPGRQEIESVWFTVDDVDSLFHDFDAFGHVIDAKPLIGPVVAANKIGREVEVGPDPQIAYFAGKTEIAAVEAGIGTVRIQHAVRYNFGGASGVYIKNRTFIVLEPAQAMTFDECIEHVMALLRFLAALGGRPQAPRSVHLRLAGGGASRLRKVKLRWSYRPEGVKGSTDIADHRPHPADIPLNAIRRPQEFATVLKHWLDRDADWRFSRCQLKSCLAKGNSYDVDRIVAAANMFDLMPETAYPPRGSLSPELEDAKAKCLAIFKPLPRGIERDAVVGTLKRLSRPSLPKIVMHRAAVVCGPLATRFPELDLVARTAIKVRNHFVHGESDDFDFASVESLTPFLNDALEFIFLAADMIEAGWDAAAWDRQHHGQGHTFSRFRASYPSGLVHLKIALSPAP